MRASSLETASQVKEFSVFLYGKMQGSGLTEIIPLICTTPICGLYAVFSHPEFPQGLPQGVAAVRWLLTAGILLPEFSQGSLSHVGELQSLMIEPLLLVRNLTNI